MKNILKIIFVIILPIIAILFQFQSFVFFIGIIFLTKIFLFYFFDTLKILNKKIDKE
jgi:hypothetical protein